MERNIICIDLKSFFASCECVDLGLDPFTTPLVVANPHQGNGAITLAITPYLKKQGVKSRSRLYEIPPYITYKIAKPRMSLYQEYSKKVYDVFLEFLSSEDILKYSIDECFLDLTNYIKLYKKTDVELAKDILKRVYDKTGLTASCGVSFNMFLAKVAMDTDGKHNSDNIAVWTKDNFKEKLWPIKPLSKVWGIGPKFEKKLNNIGIYTISDLANYDKNVLISKFGIVSNEIHNYVNGIDTRTIEKEKKEAKDKSISQSHMLSTDHFEETIKPIINDMADNLSLRLKESNKETSTINFRITYSKDIGGSFNKSVSLEKPTDSSDEIKNACNFIFDQYYDLLPIRKVEVFLYRLSEKEGTQLNLFDNVNKIYEDKSIDKVLDDIKNKYGKNSITKAANISKKN